MKPPRVRWNTTEARVERFVRLAQRLELPVYGFDPAHPRFFWFAGQGGFGIQTAPAAADLGAAVAG